MRREELRWVEMRREELPAASNVLSSPAGTQEGYWLSLTDIPLVAHQTFYGRTQAADTRNRISLRPAQVLFAIAALSVGMGAQEPAQLMAPPLAPFSAMRVAVVPVQLFRADTVGWSHGIVWENVRRDLNTAIGTVLRERGLGSRWAYPDDVIRSARRNPTFASDPHSLGVTRWRGEPPKAAEAVPPIVADNLRPLIALGDTRYALIPVELRGVGDDAIMRVVLVDARGRTVVWAGDLLIHAGADDMVATIAERFADLITEP